MQQHCAESADGRCVLLAPDVSTITWPEDGGALEHWGTSGMLKYAAALCDEIEALGERDEQAAGEVASWRRRAPPVAVGGDARLGVRRTDRGSAGCGHTP